MLILIDNYDSFTYNIVQYLQCLDQEVLVYKHDEINIQQIKNLNPNHIVISPGPKSPSEAGISMEVIKNFYQHVPILGVCLGHQCIAQVFGGSIIRSSQIFHGKTSKISHNNQKLFLNIPNLFEATRYHSLEVESKSFPGCLQVDAWTDDTIMALSHRKYPVFGLQFHPESILSQHGMQLLENFLAYEPSSIV